MVGRSIGKCLCSHLLLSGCAMRFTTRTFGCALMRAFVIAVAADFFFNCWYLELYSAQTKVQPLSCTDLLIRSVLRILCWKWKLYPRVVFYNSGFESELYCDRWSVSQFVLLSGPLWSIWPDYNFLCLTITFFLLHVGALSDERTSL
jgi:hypothetical protein